MAPKGSTMKRPAASAGVATLEAIKRAAVEPLPIAPRTPGLPVAPRTPASAVPSSVCGKSAPQPSPASGLAWQGQRLQAAPAASVASAALSATTPASAAASAAATAARVEEAERARSTAEARAAAAEVRAAESERGRAAAEGRAEAAEARAKAAIALEVQAAKLQSENDLLKVRVEELSGLWNDKVGALITSEKRVSHAEGRAECLAEQAKTAADAVERAVRAEERADIMGDLQKKLPRLFRSVAGSLASQGFVAPNVVPMPKAIKLEIDDRRASEEDLLKMKKAMLDEGPVPTDAHAAGGHSGGHDRGAGGAEHHHLPAATAGAPAPPCRSQSRERRPKDHRDPPTWSAQSTPAGPRGRSSSCERQPGGGRSEVRSNGGRHPGGEGSSSRSGQAEESSRAGMMQRAMSALGRSRQLKL